MQTRSILGMMLIVALIAMNLGAFQGLGRFNHLRHEMLIAIALTDVMVAMLWRMSGALLDGKPVSLSRAAFAATLGLGILALFFVPNMAPYRYFPYVQWFPSFSPRARFAPLPTVIGYGLLDMGVGFSVRVVPVLLPPTLAALLLRGRQIRLQAQAPPAE